ncbi:hypothetical protein SUDANB95_03517 [Actinosynnema sp. ALI-1.44]
MDLQPAAAPATALAIGSLPGVEREHDATRSHPAGSRTSP